MNLIKDMKLYYNYIEIQDIGNRKKYLQKFKNSVKY